MDKNCGSVPNPTEPILYDHTMPIIEVVRQMDVAGLQKLMAVSGRIAEETQRQFQELSTTGKVKKPAIYMYKGEVYNGLNESSFSREELVFAQNHLRILSGLYGMLRPLDQIMPYRLEMATRIHIKDTKNLYHYWKEYITRQLQADLDASGSDVLYNLASDEYYKVIDKNTIRAQIVHFEFYDMKDGKPTFVSFNAKKARGLMAAYIIKNRIKEPKMVSVFNEEGYQLRPELSKEDEMVFVR